MKAVLTPLFAALIFLSSAENARAEDGVWKAVDYNGKARWTAAFTVQGGKVVSGKLSTICDPNICNNQTYSQECSVGGFAEDKPLTDTFIGCSGWRDLRGNLFDTMQSDGESKNAGAANLKFLTGRDLEMFEAETQKPENQVSMNVDGANVSFSKLTTREYAPRIAEILAAEEAEKQRLAAAAEKQRLAQEAAERERLVAEQAERERLAAEKVEQERLAAAAAKKKRQAAARAKKKRLAAAAAKKKKLAAAKAEKAKLAAAKENAEKERLAKAKKQKMAAAKLKAEAKKKKQSAEIGIKTADQAKQFSADLQSFVQKHPDKIDALKLAEFFAPSQGEVAAGSFGAKGSNFGKLTAIMSENKAFKAYRSAAVKARAAKQVEQKKLALGKISDGVKTMKTTIAKNPLAANAFGLIKLVKQYEKVSDKEPLSTLESAVTALGDQMVKLGVKPPFAHRVAERAAKEKAEKTRMAKEAAENAERGRLAKLKAEAEKKKLAAAPARAEKPAALAPQAQPAATAAAPPKLCLPRTKHSHAAVSGKCSDAYGAGDYATVLREWQPKATGGNAPAQFNLGQLYRRGQGVKKDYDVSVKWYTKAAEHGLAIAMSNLGHMMTTKGIRASGRRDIRPNVKAALEWYKRAVDHGYTKANLYIARIYERGGFEFQADIEKAIKWYKVAAKQGWVYAQRRLGWIFRSGEQIREDMAESTKWYLMAAEKNDPTAEFYLGVDAKDDATKLKWLRRSVKHGGGNDAKKQLAKAERDIARKAAAKKTAEENAKPEVQLKNGYSRYMFIQGCYDIRKSYLVKYLSDEQMAAAKVSIKEFENHYKSKYKNIDTGAAWEQATAAFEKEFGNTFRTLSSIPDYNKQTKASCQLEHMALTSFRAPGAKAKKKKKDF
ncbi:MAG: sel1 repeat family protein [Rhodospirillaceae bacterium]|nr:sel1 repeat family protein [Rhodospirillaceae bacterium]